MRTLSYTLLVAMLRIPFTVFSTSAQPDTGSEYSGRGMRPINLRSKQMRAKLYLQDVESKIQNLLRKKQLNLRRLTLISFRLNKDGQINDVKIVKSSGSKSDVQLFEGLLKTPSLFANPLPEIFSRNPWSIEVEMCPAVYVRPLSRSERESLFKLE